MLVLTLKSWNSVNLISSFTNFLKHASCPFNHTDSSFSNLLPVLITIYNLCYSSISDLLKTLTTPIICKYQKSESPHIWRVYKILHFSPSFQLWMALAQPEHELTRLPELVLKITVHYFSIDFLIKTVLSRYKFLPSCKKKKSIFSKGIELIMNSKIPRNGVCLEFQLLP